MLEGFVTLHVVSSAAREAVAAEVEISLAVAEALSLGLLSSEDV